MPFKGSFASSLPTLKQAPHVQRTSKRDWVGLKLVISFQPRRGIKEVDTPLFVQLGMGGGVRQNHQFERERSIGSHGDQRR